MRGNFTPFIQIRDHFFPLVFPKDSENLKSLDIGLREGGGTKMFKWSEQRKKKTFFCRGDSRPFLSKNVHIWDHFFPLLFPKDSESLKILDIRLWEVGAKRRLNSTSKMNFKKIIIKKTFFAAAILDKSLICSTYINTFELLLYKTRQLKTYTL